MKKEKKYELIREDLEVQLGMIEEDSPQELYLDANALVKQTVEAGKRCIDAGLSQSDISIVLNKFGLTDGRTLLDFMVESQYLTGKTSAKIKSRVGMFMDAYQGLLISKEFDAEVCGHCIPERIAVMQGLIDYGTFDEVKGRNKGNVMMSDTVIGGFSRQVEDNPVYQQKS